MPTEGPSDSFRETEHFSVSVLESELALEHQGGHPVLAAGLVRLIRRPQCGLARADRRGRALLTTDLGRAGHDHEELVTDSRVPTDDATWPEAQDADAGLAERAKAGDAKAVAAEPVHVMCRQAVQRDDLHRGSLAPMVRPEIRMLCDRTIAAAAVLQ